jgi:Ca2+-binding RTX toxin-like protein
MHAIAPGRGAGALLLTIGLAVTGTAYAHPSSRATTPTCDGHRATIVGRPGQHFVGTEHRDVIVTNGGYGSARRGNDLMCVTGSARQLQTVLTGKGRDHVDARMVPAGHRDSVVLGSGSDSFRGGVASDFVYAGAGDNVVHTGAGHDFVDTGSFTRHTPNHSRVHVGPGPDIVAVEGRAAGVAVDGGGGSNKLFPFDYCCRASRMVLDMRRHVLTRDGRAVMRIRGFNRFQIPLPPRHLTFVGTAASEQLGFDSAYLCCRRPPRAPFPVRIDMGAGADRVDSTYELHGRVSGGPGKDELTTLVRARSDVHINLSRALVEDGQPVLQIAALERTHWRLAGSAPTVLVTGTPRGDRVWLAHTRFGPVRGQVTMDGFGGDDRLTTRIQPATLRGGAGHDVLRVHKASGHLYGGPGNDVLWGGRHDDVLVGGPGHDTAHGSLGTDRCRAEVETGCELPVG